MTNGRQELPPNALERMFLLQYGVQQAYETRRGVPTVPLTMTDEQRVIYVKDMFIAMVAELVEFIGELKWKPWSDAEPYFHREAAFGEAVDIWHFAMNIAMAAAPDGADPADVARMLFAEYKAKNAENQRRAMGGYDGTADKCPKCKRDLRDYIRHNGVEVFEQGDAYFCYCDEDITAEVQRILATTS